jgi:hypothetical protein
VPLPLFLFKKFKIMRTEANRKITIMGLLAECSTDDAKQLLKKYGLPDAKNKQDLELKLATLYKKCDDKKQLEKDFAEIHPHKEFMKKYLLPTPPVKAEVVLQDLTPPPSLTVESISTPEIVSNCDGKTCTCNSSNFSGVDGLQTNATNNSNDKDKLIIFGMFGFFSILALVLISQKK